MMTSDKKITRQASSCVMAFVFHDCLHILLLGRQHQTMVWLLWRIDIAPPCNMLAALCALIDYILFPRVVFSKWEMQKGTKTREKSIINNLVSQSVMPQYNV